MNKNFSFIFFLLFLVAGKVSFSQNKPRSYTASRFALRLNGSNAGWLKPVEKGDTLTYTLIKLSDSIFVRKKFDSAFSQPSKKYYLKYKLKKKS